MLTSRSPTFQLVVVQRQDALARPAAQPRDHPRQPALRGEMGQIDRARRDHPQRQHGERLGPGLAQPHQRQ